MNIPTFKDVSVLVVGDVMLDEYWYGSSSRISPEAPVPVVRVENMEGWPGGAGNVACNIAALGGLVDLVSIVGDDEEAERLMKILDERGVRCHFQFNAIRRTEKKIRVLCQHQQMIRLDLESKSNDVDDLALIESYQELTKGTDVVVLSDYGKGTLKSISRLIKDARKENKPVLIDPKGTDFSKYCGATLITPNRSEFEAVVGRCDSIGILTERGERLREEVELDALLITRGDEGMTLLRKGAECLHFHSSAREVYDVTGAGDTVIATLAAGLAAGVSMEDSVAAANLAAGLVVSKLGASTISSVELHRAHHELEDIGYGVITEDELEWVVRSAQMRGVKIIMTNGCFDLLHTGHVTYLEQARALGDRLVVAVNSDESVSRIKGEGRPVNSLEQRMTVLSALSSVDWVVSFSEDTPERLYCRIRPDVVTKGGDYQPDEVVGSKCVQESGGKVVILGYVDGESSTAMLERMKGVSALPSHFSGINTGTERCLARKNNH